MDKSELERFIQRVVLRVKSGEQVEEDKIELKREWYKFESGGKEAESEFLKDIAAIANTFGRTGYLIIGVDESNGSLWDSPLSQTKFKDISNLRGLVVKGIDRPVDFDFYEISFNHEGENHIISVFVIPPSMEKPHIIKSFISAKGQQVQNYIPVRKATSINPANRNDIELMYYDRKNIQSEYALEVKTYNQTLLINNYQNEFNIEFQICIINFGFKPSILVEIKLQLNNIIEEGLQSELVLPLKSYTPDFSVSADQYNLSLRFLKVPGNQAETIYCKFSARFHIELIKKLKHFLENKKGVYTVNVELTDINSKKYISEDLQL